MPDPEEITRSLGVEPVRDGDRLRWWCPGVTPVQEAVATELGLRQVRRLHQMRVPLPLGETTDVAVRSFRPGVDDDAWLATNNRSFAWHPDQGGWTRAVLDERLAEPWFEAEGFLLHDGPDGTIAAFCWTKHHAQHAPPLGEIYVIGVDPAHQGRGLGRALTVAGLAWQWEHHRPPLGMLYVEHDNAAGLGLYRNLGFEVHHDDVAYEVSDAT